MNQPISPKVDLSHRVRNTAVEVAQPGVVHQVRRELDDLDDLNQVVRQQASVHMAQFQH